MKKHSFIAGSISILIGVIAGSAFMSWIGKTSNEAININPIDAFQSLYFAASFGFGPLGIAIAIICLLLYLFLFFSLGIWIYKKYISKNNF